MREEPPPQPLRDSYMATPYQKEIDALLAEAPSGYNSMFWTAIVVLGVILVGWQVQKMTERK